MDAAIYNHVQTKETMHVDKPKQLKEPVAMYDRDQHLSNSHYSWLTIHPIAMANWIAGYIHKSGLIPKIYE